MTTDAKKAVAEGSRGREASKTDMAKTLADHARELEALQIYTKTLADQLKASDVKTLADQAKTWKALMENAKTLREQVKALVATKVDTKTLADQETTWKALRDYTETLNESARELDATKADSKKTLSDYVRVLENVRTLGAMGRNARAFGEGFTSVLSPSFYLWLENDDYEKSYSPKHSSLREIWEQVGQHLDDAASIVVTSKHGRRSERREG
jgi:hypothetical protein